MNMRPRHNHVSTLILTQLMIILSIKWAHHQCPALMEQKQTRPPPTQLTNFSPNIKTPSFLSSPLSLYFLSLGFPSIQIRVSFLNQLLRILPNALLVSSITSLRNPNSISMLSSSSYSISNRPLILPSLSKIRVSNRSTRSTRFPYLNRSFRVTDLRFSGSKSKWKICCFRQEECPEEKLESEVVDDILAEELVKSKVENPIAVNKDWSSSFRKAAVAFFRAIGDRWTVPWTWETILQVMLLWIASFWFVGSWMMPFAAHVVGFGKESLTYRGQALYSLLTDVMEGLAGIAILHRCLSHFRPLPSGWFKFSLKGNWHFDVALGCLMFPLVNRLSQFNLDLLPLLPSTPVTLSSVEQSILARDPVAMGLYAIVVSVCAPIWEEIVFRGFLLPSLTRYMPVWCSILVSSVVFALAHFNVQRMLPLILLGVVMGAIFARSRNLVPSMLLHSLWNAFVFLDLMK